MKSFSAFILFLGFSTFAQAQGHSQAFVRGSFNFKCGHTQLLLSVEGRQATLRFDNQVIELPVADDCLASAQAKGAQWCAYSQLLHLRAPTDTSAREINLNANFKQGEAEISFINEYSSYQSKPEKCRLFHSN